MPAPKQIIELVERFERNLEEYKLGRYNEAQVRQEFINPFFEALGWDMNNRQGLAEAYKEVIHEDSIKVGMGTKAPDYCFRIGGTRKFFLEAKNPSVNIRDNIDPSYQIRRYAWSAKLPLSLLTDFEEFSVYDTRIKPKKNDKASTARILYFTFRDYIDKWDEIASIFSRDAIVKGSFDKYVESTKKKRGTAEVDVEFLDEIEKWRAELAKDIAKNNKKISQSNLNYSIQKIIDRIIFLRICEDRGIEDYGKLQALLNGTHAYQRLCEDFERADQKYNSGLFHFKTEKDVAENPDEITLKLKVSDDAVKSIIKNLYFPDSPYEFSVITADILGKVYEQFLGKVIRLTASHRVVIEEKPEVRKAGGVYYTPVYIVDYIIKNTVGKLLEGKTPEQASKLKILDPACGSGSFLIGAYQLLLDWHLDWYINNDPKQWAMKKKPALYQSTHGGWKLTISERKRILLNNIHGVDIDPQAVEVTKLSLLLKVLEGDVDPYLKQQLSMSFMTERALPDLGSNIKCGNSLIGPDFYEGKNLSLFGAKEMEKINTFDWNSKEKGFGEIMSKGGFDVVIGNPPWVFGGNYGIDSIEKSFFKNKYKSGDNKINLFTLFIEKGLQLLKKKGLLSFIVPNTFLRVTSYHSIRKYVLDNYSIEIIVNNGVGVFEGVTASAITLIISNSKEDSHKVKMLDGKFELTASVDQSAFSSNDYVINAAIDKYSFGIINKIKQNRIDLGSICKELIFGVVITKNIDRVVSRTRKNNKYKKYLEGRDMGRYCIKWDNKYLLYDKKKLHRARTPEIFEAKEKIIIQRITGGKTPLKATLDRERYYNRESINNIILRDDSKYSTEFILGLLNSKLINYFYNISFTNASTLTVNLSKEYLSRIPIPNDIQSGESKEIYKQINGLVTQMLETQRDLHSSMTENDKKQYQQKIEILDKQIDALVYELYGLTEEEIRVVEEE